MINWFNILLTYRKTWLDDIPRTVFSSIDKAVYNLISSVYGLIEDLAHVKIFQEGVIEEFYGKVYALLAIFMIFKVTFSIISYVVIGIGVVLNIWSMLNYIIKNRNVIKEQSKKEE